MTELRELRDTELDAVYGGLFDTTVGPVVTQTNVATQTGVAIGGAGGVFGGNGGSADVRQLLAQINFSSIR